MPAARRLVLGLPFYYRGTTGTTWGSNGAVQVLGFNAATGPNDQNQQVTFTEMGIQWGLVTPWSSTRPTSPTVTDNLTVLAVDNNGNAAGWVKHYLPGDTFRGFVRIEDHSGAPAISRTDRVAVYADDQHRLRARARRRRERHPARRRIELGRGRIRRHA
jgi:hypothetical protein